MARRFFAPVLVSGVENRTDHSVELWVSNDTFKPLCADLQWKLFSVDGSCLQMGTVAASVGSSASRKQKTLLFKRLAQNYDMRNTLLFLDLVHNKKVISSNAVTFYTYKHICLEQPHLSVAVQQLSETQFNLTLAAKKPALCVNLQLPQVSAQCSDNFFHLYPGITRSVAVTLNKKIPLHRLEKRLKLQSLIDTYC
jgi:beta-mannosidase